MFSSRPEIQDNIRALVKAELGLTVQRVQQITQRGLVNAVSIVETSGGKFVVRQSEKETVGTYLKERACADAARVVGIRTPEVVAVGAREDVAFHLSEYIEGLDVAEVDSVQRLRAWGHIGGMLKVLHTLPAKGFGEDLFGPIHGAHTTTARDWAEWFKEYCAAMEEGLIQQGLSRRQLHLLDEVFERLDKVSGDPVICHGNAAVKNFRIDTQGRTWLLDWGTAAGHRPELELAELHAFDVSESELAAFYRQYGRGYSVHEQPLRDFTIARLGISAAWLLQQTPVPSADLAMSMRNLKRLLE